MACLRFTCVLLLLPLLCQVRSVRPEPVFRAKGSNIEMGFCFGVDYIVVYRAAREGDQLLGNSSHRNLSGAPPADLRGRTRITEDHNLLGLQITNLTHKDSGVYRRECWENRTQVSQHTHQLTVCNEEIESEEITVKEEEGGGARLHCRSDLIGQEGVSVRWYHEMYPNYKLTLFLDSGVSMTSLAEAQLGVVEVRDKGASLVLDESALKNNHHFYCLVIKGGDCLSFQNMYPPDHSDARDVFASQGDRVVLNCSADGQNQQWETPLGKINDSRMSSKAMQLSSAHGDFSLVLPAVSEEHGGEYSCISSTLERLFFLVICPRQDSPQKVVPEGGTVSLQCSLDQMTSHRVRWYRHDRAGEEELLHDTDDQTVAIPEGLRGRLTLADDGSSLAVSGVTASDGGEYFCVVFKSSEFAFDAYLEDYEDEGTEGPDDADDADDAVEEYWPDAMKCFLKQVTVVSIGSGRAVTPPPDTAAATSTAAPGSVNVALVAAAAGAGVGVVAIAAIIAGIVMKRRANASKQRQAASGQHGRAGIQLERDPGCNEPLTNTKDLS